MLARNSLPLPRSDCSWQQSKLSFSCPADCLARRRRLHPLAAGALLASSSARAVRCTFWWAQSQRSAFEDGCINGPWLLSTPAHARWGRHPTACRSALKHTSRSAQPTQVNNAGAYTTTKHTTNEGVSELCQVGGALCFAVVAQQGTPSRGPKTGCHCLMQAVGQRVLRPCHCRLLLPNANARTSPSACVLRLTTLVPTC